MYILIAGGGKVGSNLTATLLQAGHEITLLEGDRGRYGLLEERFGNVVRYGDAAELFVLERAGVERAEMLVAVTGDDEDNLVACQVARDKYGVPKVIARVNDPRNQPHFEMLDIRRTVSATAIVLGLIEHELPSTSWSPCSTCAGRTSRSSRSASAPARRLRGERFATSGSRAARG